MTKKHAIIIFTALLLALSSCKKDIIVPESDFKRIFGNWKWVESYSSSKGIETPSSEGYEVEIEFKSNGVFKKFQDGKRIQKKCFTFEKKASIHSSEEIYLLDFYKGKAEQIDNAFEFIGDDKLILHLECIGCQRHTYIRK